MRCAQQHPDQAAHHLDDPLVQGLNETDSEWFRARSLITYVNQINVPMHITGAYQDEQTGPAVRRTCGSRSPACRSASC